MKQREHCLDPNLVAVMRNPTVEGAMGFYEPFRRRMGWPYPLDVTPEIAALACIHGTRIRWAGAKEMVRTSKAWLIEHGMSLDAYANSSLGVH